MILSTIDYINGFFALTHAIVMIIVGIRIALKYFKYKHRTFLFVGIGFAGFSCGWWGSGFGFLYFLITNRLFDDTFYIFITIFFAPIFPSIFIIGISELVFTNKKKQLILKGYLLVISIFIIVYILYYIIYDPSIIAVKVGAFDLTWGLVIMVYLLILFATIYLTLLGFVIKALRSDDTELRLKGKILLVAMQLLLIGTILDSIYLTDVTLIFARTLLISSSLLFYIGYLLPERIKRIFLKE